MKLQQFEGGVSSRLAPQLINNNQGVVYENIDNASGVLKPIKDKLATAIEIKPYFKYFSAEDSWVSSNKPTDYLEFQRVMYLTNRTSRAQKYSKGRYNNLGIERPAAASTLSVTSRARPVTHVTALNKTNTGDLPAADLDYLLFNVKDDILSTPFKITVYASSSPITRAKGAVVSFNELTKFSSNTIITETQPANRSVQFSALKGTFADNVQLFRYYDGDWYHVHTFTSKNDVKTDNVYDISYRRKLNEADISVFNGTYQYVYTFFNSKDGSESAPSPISGDRLINSGKVRVSLPSTSNDPQVTHKRLYRVGGDIAKFTMVTQLANSETAFIDNVKDIDLDGRLLESENYYEAPAKLKYLIEAYAMLFGVVGSTLRFTPPGKPNAWPPEYSIQFDRDITGIGAVSNGILVFTNTKTFIVTGTGPTSLAQQTLRGDQGCVAFESIQEAYAGALIWASEDGLCMSSGNNVESITKGLTGQLMLLPVSSAVHDEVYYCHNSDGTTLAWDYRFQPTLKWLNLGIKSLAYANGKLYGYCSGFLNLLYKDTNNLTFKYKSPLFVEGSFSENKTYKKVYVRSEGDIIINIIIDNEIVANFNLTGTDTHQLQIPQHLQRGYSIQFEVEGTGTVQEIEYVAGPRQNG